MRLKIKINVIKENEKESVEKWKYQETEESQTTKIKKRRI